MGPEVVGMDQQRLIKVRPCVSKVAVFVLFLAGQEMIEGRVSRQGLGRGVLPLRGRSITALGQENGASPMIHAGGGPQLGRPVEKPQALVGLVGRLGQDQQQLVTAVLDLGLVTRSQARRRRTRCPGTSEPGRANTASAARVARRRASWSLWKSTPVKLASW